MPLANHQNVQLMGAYTPPNSPLTPRRQDYNTLRQTTWWERHPEIRRRNPIPGAIVISTWWRPPSESRHPQPTCGLLLIPSLMVAPTWTTPHNNNNKNAPQHTVRQHFATILKSPHHYITRLVSLLRWTLVPTRPTSYNNEHFNNHAWRSNS